MSAYAITFVALGVCIGVAVTLALQALAGFKDSHHVHFVGGSNAATDH